MTRKYQKRVPRNCAYCGRLFLPKTTKGNEPTTRCSQKCYALDRFGTPIERFWEKVNKAGQTILDDSCWEWIGVRNNEGYGYFYESGRKVTAHRWSYGHFKGPIPPGLVICHRCDNPACVRPNHLFAGTPTENAQDCIRKGRKGNAKLSLHKVAEIKRMLNEGVEPKHVSVQFLISMTTIYAIRRGKTWATIEPALACSRKVQGEK